MTRAAVAVLVVLVGSVAACDLGASPTVPERSPTITPESPSGAPELRVDRWRGAITSRSEHQLYVGGSCVSDWRTELSLRVGPGGRVIGSGVARLVSTGDPCPFPVAQLQIRRFVLDVSGRLRGRRLEIRLSERSSRPSAGADDLGGFRETALSTDLTIHAVAGGALDRVVLTAPDQDRGAFRSTSVVRLRCLTCD